MLLSGERLLASQKVLCSVKLIVCLQLHNFKILCFFLNFCPHVSSVKFPTDHFVSSAVHAAVGCLESDTNKCRIAMASGQKENLVIVHAGNQTYYV
jgi:hypothetical protein